MPCFESRLHPTCFRRHLPRSGTTFLMAKAPVSSAAKQGSVWSGAGSLFFAFDPFRSPVRRKIVKTQDAKGELNRSEQREQIWVSL